MMSTYVELVDITKKFSLVALSWDIGKRSGKGVGLHARARMLRGDGISSHRSKRLSHN